MDDLRLTLIFTAHSEAYVRVSGVFAGICARRALSVSLPKRQGYALEANFPQNGALRLQNAALTFMPDRYEQTQTLCAEITRYAPDVFGIHFLPVFAALGGVPVPTAQLRFSGMGKPHVFTLYGGASPAVQLECDDSILCRPLPLNGEHYTLHTHTLGGEPLAAVRGELDGRRYALLFGYRGDYTEHGEFTAHELRLEQDNVTVTHLYSDMRQHAADEVYAVNNGTMYLSERKVSARLPVRDTPALLPYYFLEAVAAGAEEESLSYLKEGAFDGLTFAQLKQFLGDFERIEQNPHNPQTAALPSVKQQTAPRIYRYTAFRFTVQDGRICNITEG